MTSNVAQSGCDIMHTVDLGIWVHLITSIAVKLDKTMKKYGILPAHRIAAVWEKLASRGVAEITSVDKDFGCVKFVKETAQKLAFSKIQVRKQDVFIFLKNDTNSYDLIFADPPYALDKIVDLSVMVFEKQLLAKNGMLIIEHGSHLDLSSQKGFFEERKYGQSTFSFFKNPE
jgi:16S rRNA G966 N2-methylase RsmD